jgi:hypothetical protein
MGGYFEMNALPDAWDELDACQAMVDPPAHYRGVRDLAKQWKMCERLALDRANGLVSQKILGMSKFLVKGHWQNYYYLIEPKADAKPAMGRRLERKGR